MCSWWVAKIGPWMIEPHRYSPPGQEPVSHISVSTNTTYLLSLFSPQSIIHAVGQRNTPHMHTNTVKKWLGQKAEENNIRNKYKIWSHWNSPVCNSNMWEAMLCERRCWQTCVLQQFCNCVSKIDTSKACGSLPESRRGLVALFWQMINWFVFTQLNTNPKGWANDSFRHC